MHYSTNFVSAEFKVGKKPKPDSRPRPPLKTLWHSGLAQTNTKLQLQLQAINKSKLARPSSGTDLTDENNGAAFNSGKMWQNRLSALHPESGSTKMENLTSQIPQANVPSRHLNVVCEPKPAPGAQTNPSADLYRKVRPDKEPQVKWSDVLVEHQVERVEALDELQSGLEALVEAEEGLANLSSEEPEHDALAPHWRGKRLILRTLSTFKNVLTTQRWRQPPIKISLEDGRHPQMELDIGLCLDNFCSIITANANNFTREALTVDIYFGLVDKNEKVFSYSQQSHHLMPGRQDLYIENIKSWGFVTKNPELYLPGGRLNIVCQVTIVEKQFQQLKKLIIGPQQDQVEIAHQLFRDFSSASSRKEFCDFILTSGKTKFPCHRFVLISRSQVLSAMLATRHAIGMETKELDLSQYPPETLGKFVEFMYSNRLDSYNSIELMEIAEAFGVLGLKWLCEKALSKELDLSNCVRYLYEANRFKAEFLEGKAAGVIINNLSKIIKTDDWANLVQTRPQAMKPVLDYVASLTE